MGLSFLPAALAGEVISGFVFTLLAWNVCSNPGCSVTRRNLFHQLGFNELRQQAKALDLRQALSAPERGVAALTETDLFLPALTCVFGASVRGARRSLASLAP